jgi:hypothetical protein
MEFSFLTIIISLAVCSLLVYALFQYTKVRLNVLEQSHKEQAMILQQFIEESSIDIHRLYRLNNNQQLQPQGSIILEYADEMESSTKENTQTNNNIKPSAYNEPHLIHLDTALFKNKRSNLIEISSDSEDTTDSGSNSDSASASDTDNASESSGDTNSSSDSDSDSDRDNEIDIECEDTIHKMNVTDIVDNVSDNISDIVNKHCETEQPSAEIKLVTVDLGVVEEPVSMNNNTNDVLSMLYKKSMKTDESVAVVEPELSSASVPTPTPTPTPVVQVSYSSMSVSELRQLLKEKYKNNPEKHPEIQKLKKVELVHALQTAPA